ncbi:protein Tos4p [[Candida] anglica]|uniref:Protein Tos4p n=1 Tax=[Candida] anglica TaxID=148631 RepID=A0ABP0E8M3_9ASCO
MSSYQFPPSSPLIGDAADYQEHDPFAVKGKDTFLQRGRSKQYPTPNPSSTTGRSSSPVRAEEVKFDLAVKPKKAVSFNLDATTPVAVPMAQPKSTHQVSINRNFNVLNPDANVLRVPLRENGSILIGRSSKSCDYHFKTMDKTISRTHLAVTCKDEHVILECMGYSGFLITIPKACLVYGSNKTNDYILMETQGSALSFNDLQTLGYKVTPRTISLDANHTQFFVNRCERVTLPKIDNIFVQIRDNVLLLNPVEDMEDVTDDEEPTLIVKPSVVLEKMTPVKSSLKVTQPLAEIETKPVDVEQKEVIAESIERKQSDNVNLAPKKKIFQELSTPIKSVMTTSSTPVTPAKSTKSTMINLRATSEEPTPTYSLLDKSELNFQIFSDVEDTPSKEVIVPSKAQPLNDITHENSFTSSPSKKPSTGEFGGKRKKKKTSPQPRPIIDQSSIEGLTNMSEINNVLLNHLAFSRLSSTPASFLNTISALTSDLSLTQMRAILHNLKPIGVIYREGKDAAGKPLEEEYYYIPEQDDDIERPKLVASIKGHGGLRSCRRTHKQYYWKKPAPIKK